MGTYERSSPGPVAFEPTKRLDDRADYCLGCISIKSLCINVIFDTNTTNGIWVCRLEESIRC